MLNTCKYFQYEMPSSLLNIFPSGFLMSRFTFFAENRAYTSKHDHNMISYGNLRNRKAFRKMGWEGYLRVWLFKEIS